MNKIKISASIIVKNEESCLERCLKSIKGIDEISILDTGSTDKTKEIALRYTSKYYANEYKWNDNFAEARNYALTKCIGDWILTIDADEELEVNGIEKIRREIKKAETKGLSSVDAIIHHGSVKLYSVRVYRRRKNIFWKGAIHNYLNMAEQNRSNILIKGHYSKSHKNDPDRALRILLKTVIENPKAKRELYYLGREYMNKDFIKAIHYLNEYLKLGKWQSQIADAYLLKARCLWRLNKGEEARNTCLQAIKINANFKEALLLMADMSWSKNRDKWLAFANLATNEDVLFNRTVSEKKAEYYNKHYEVDNDMSRYDAIVRKVGELAKGKILDIGCGTGHLQKYVRNYLGFDFSDKAVEIANSKKVKKGNAYNPDLYKGDFDTYVALEVLEHLDDIKILKNIPKGKSVIFSVPSFKCPSHIRIYTRELVKTRFKKLVNIQQIIRFNLDGNKWSNEVDKKTKSYILLIEGVKL